MKLNVVIQTDVPDYVFDSVDIYMPHNGVRHFTRGLAKSLHDMERRTWNFTSELSSSDWPVEEKYYREMEILAFEGHSKAKREYGQDEVRLVCVDVYGYPFMPENPRLPYVEIPMAPDIYDLGATAAMDVEPDIELS